MSVFEFTVRNPKQEAMYFDGENAQAVADFAGYSRYTIQPIAGGRLLTLHYQNDCLEINIQENQVVTKVNGDISVMNSKEFYSKYIVV